ncbi:MAG: glycoside hydrolase family 3 C-terminal domain-containing protein [Bacteroidota bacterium]|nr:glycoside hydrolase family 3 C-terminal domain-containing protein [Bacteroidota bacterium]
MKKTFFILLAILASHFLKAQNDTQAKARQMVNKMTLDEKVAVVVGMGMKLPGMAQGKPVVGEIEDQVPGAAGRTSVISHLGIPSIILSDGPAGVRIAPFRHGDSSISYYATAWPVATLMASTWDTSLIKKMGVAFGGEIKDYGIDIILAPALNIQRNPLGGRNFEYYSEDPLVAGSMAAAVVNGIQSNGVGTSIKHFAANNQETNRNAVNTIVSERALREIYLKGFEIAVKKSHPWTVMSSYNKINGTYTSEEYDLLTTILRKEWGFKGMVMTDWFGGKDAVEQLKAGNDLLMPGMPQQTKAIIEAVKNGTLNEAVLNENVERILKIIFQSPTYKKFRYSDKPDLKKNASISREVAEEGMILLKNNNQALPFNKNVHNIALFGVNGYELIAGGTGSGNVNKAYTVSLFKGLSTAGYNIDADLKNTYINYISAAEKVKHPKKNSFEEFINPTPPVQEYPVDVNVINKKANEADMAIISIGRNAGEGRDRKLVDDFNLSDTEKTLINNVSMGFHSQNKKVVVVLNIGGVIEVASWRDGPDAILLAWQPGQEGGNAVTNLLNGKVNPSGKLAITFPKSYEDVPSAKSFPGKEFPEQATIGMFGMKSTPAEVVYDEGIFVGYRYYNTFDVKTAYEFGYGLSYTNFTYSNLKLNSSIFNGKLIAAIDIKNSGTVAGKEVVQLYISAPSKEQKKPAEELRSFAKTNLLKPGQSQTIKFMISPNDLASFDTKTTSWIAEAGSYELKIGASSADIKQSANFQVKKDLIVEKDHNVLTPQVTIPEFQK